MLETFWAETFGPCVNFGNFMAGNFLGGNLLGGYHLIKLIPTNTKEFI